MALFNWGRKKEETVTDEVKLKEEVKPKEVKPTFLETIRELDFGWARISNIRRTGNGVSVNLNINPSYIFPSGAQRMGAPKTGFSPTMGGYGDGLLLVDGVPSRISNINLDLNLTDRERYDRYDGYDRESGRYGGYDRNVSRYHGGRSARNTLSFERQVLSNAFDGLVTQTKKSILTDSKYCINIPINSNFEITDESDLRYRLSMVRDIIKSAIEDNFRKEIIKSKLVETKDKFFTDLSPELMTDIFQHVTDIVPDCKLIINTESTPTFPIIKFFVPLIGKNSEPKSQKISFEFNEKTSNILYELSECANRIKGYCDNSESKISFSSDGILIETFPESISQHLEVKDYSGSMNDGYFRDSMYGDLTLRQQAIRVRNPYNDWNLE
jgi:hypothetical protein